MVKKSACLVASLVWFANCVESEQSVGQELGATPDLEPTPTSAPAETREIPRAPKTQNSTQTGTQPSGKPASEAEGEKRPFNRLNRLDQVAPPGSVAGSLVGDVRLLLQAELATSENKHREAADFYLAAMDLTKGKLADPALKGWVINSAAALEKKTKSAFVARLLLDQVEGKKRPGAKAYLKRRGLLDLAKLNKTVAELASDHILPEEEKPEVSRRYPNVPKEKGPIAKDPTMEVTAKNFCRGSGPVPKKWQNWEKSLAKPIRTYWLGLVAQCQKEHVKSLGLLKKAGKLLQAKKATANIKVRALYRAVRLERRLGSRERAASIYLQLIDATKNKNVSARGLGFTKSKFHLERVNNTLWAARYQALVGKYKKAKILARQALKLIGGKRKAKIHSSKALKILADYKAEAYIILSSRIGWEVGDKKSAADGMAKATKIKGMTPGMRDRVRWYAGLFQYLAGKSKSAKKYWKALEKEAEKDSSKAQAYFWLARVHHEAGEKKEASKYLQMLEEEFPLSFYFVVGAKAAGLSPEKPWTGKFRDVESLRKKLSSETLAESIGKKLKPDVKRLVERGNILLRAELSDWALLNASDLKRAIHASYNTRKEPEVFVYLSRKLYEAGDYIGGIVITARLATEDESFWNAWPEQVLAYYPAPHHDLYRRSGETANVDPGIMLSVARQESGFNERAVSPAHAYGLMQLIVPTAGRYAKAAGLSKENLKQRLLEPDVSIRIGSQYLKTLGQHYKGYIPALLAAYNAGEYAVDRWIEKRMHDDPLAWIELIPFGETRGYVKNVWRNMVIYQYLDKGRTPAKLEVYLANSGKKPMGEESH